MKSPRAVAASLLVACCALSGCTAAEVNTQQPPSVVPAPRTTVAPIVTRCPAGAIRPEASGIPGADRELVPFAPTTALVCQYRHFPTPKLVSSASATSSASLATMRRQINHGARAMPSGTVNCPNDDGTVADVYFSARGSQIELSFELTGCEQASNGTLTNQRMAFANVPIG